MRSYLRLLTVWTAALLIVGCGSQPGKREFRKGRAALEAGDYVIAKTWLENTVNETTDEEIKSQAYNLLGVASWQLNELQDATEYFKTALDINPELQESIYNLAVLSKKKGDELQSTSLMEDAAMISTDGTRPLEYLGRIYLRDQRWADARRTYMEALKRSPKSARILTSLGLAEFYLDQPDTAKDYWQKALESERDYAPAIFNMAYINLSGFGEREAGREYADRFLALDDIAGNSPQASSLRRLIADDNARERTVADNKQASRTARGKDSDKETARSMDILEEARLRRRQGERGHALNLCLQEAIRAKREGEKSRQLEALQTAATICFDQSRAHYALGRFYLENNEPEKAIKSLQQAVAINPDWARAQIALAKGSIAMQNYDTAIVALKKALQLDERDAEALWTLAELYDKHIDNKKASLNVYKKFSDLFPGDPRVLTAQDRIEKIERGISAPVANETSPKRQAPARNAQTQSQRTREPDRSAAVVAFNRGVRAQSRKDWQTAIASYQRAVEADPSLERAHFNLGVVYGMTGQNEKAAKAYLATIANDPDYVNARFNLALIYYSREEYSEAARQLKFLLRTDSSHAKANFLLGLIYAEQSQNKELAKKYYRRYLQLAPRDRNAVKVRAWLKRH